MDVRASFGWLLVALLPVCGPGCSSSDSLQSVEGKVLVDGKPAKGAVVFFHLKGGDAIKSQRPSGVAGEDGAFSLTTGTKDGAPAGEYIVTLIWPGEPVVKAKGKLSGTDLEEPERPDRLGGRYADAKTSKLQATVRSGRNRLPPFEVR